MTISAEPLNACRGDQPLEARWEPWMDRLLGDREACVDLLETFGSPIHLHNKDPFFRNALELQRSAAQSGVDLFVHFARKANKCLGYVDAAGAAGIGVDVASYEELVQTLNSGIPASDIIVTSAVKPQNLVELCVTREVRMAIDNDDEAMRILAECKRQRTQVCAAVRLSFSTSGSMASRFGIPVEEVSAAARRWTDSGHIKVDGLHFHLDGYDPTDRVDALDTTMKLSDALRQAEIANISFIDMGGGFPMRYLQHTHEWASFWVALGSALCGAQRPLTYRNHGYGLAAHAGEIVGTPQAYPHAQTLVGGDWLRVICDAPRPSQPSRSVSESLAERGLRLHCEPGRSLLDGCGMTLARVEHRKRIGDDWLLGLAMNSSNCRSQKSELFADPRLVPSASPLRRGESISGYLAGAYCAEGDLIMHRRLRFDHGVEVGDIIAIPNTAGYLMHFTESRSHQFPLPFNVDVSGHIPRLDRIDAPSTDHEDTTW